jgi:Family of unknown function (DUF6519)
MGNYSRDPDARAADAAAKHYVAVRLQQAVPVLDADWNLLEDLRRRELETVAASFIGDGVPAGSDGFHILASANANDFLIRGGLCIVGGKLVVNDADTSYATQPNFGNARLVPPLAALTTPPADKQFIVYLDVFEEEVDSLGDPLLVDPRIGVETAIRLRRNWAVRVARVPEDLQALSTPPAGHLFLRLAQLNRLANNANITTAMIADLRDTQLSVKRKIEVRDAANNIVVDNTRVQQMLQNTRDILLAFVRYIGAQYNPAFLPLTAAEVLGLQAADHIARVADAGLALVNTSSMANTGALNFLRQVYDAESNFLGIWRDVVLTTSGSVKKYASYATFLQRLDDRLNKQTVGILTGLGPALTAGNLAAAVAMQEEIARLFGTASKTIPRGAITVFLANSPPGNLTPGPNPVRFEFRVRSATTLADTYTVTVLPATGWPRLVVDAAGNPVPGNKVSIGPQPAEVPIFVNVTVQAGTSGLQLQVMSDQNPDEINQTSSLFTLTAGQPAPLGEDKVQFNISPNIVNGTKDPATGAINIARGNTCTLTIQIVNNSGQNASFDLTAAKQNEVAANAWTLTPQFNTPMPINNGQSVQAQIRVLPQNAPAVSLQVLFTASATIQGSTVSGQFVIPFVAT